MKKNNRGFTLVELSIVLVIIGLIIGGVLTGQQIIQNARITSAINAVQAYAAQFQTYAQNYSAVPGDDAGATTRFPTLGQSVGGGRGNGNGDGSVGDNASFATSSTDLPAGESLLVWAQLRAANLVKNQVTNNSTAVQPSNPFGGVFGFQNGGLNGVFTTTVLCLNKVPANAAQAIDARLDDGVSNAGSVQATSDTGLSAYTGNTEVATTYADGQTYTVCHKL